MILGRSELDGSDLDMGGEQDPAIYAMKRLECIYSARIRDKQEEIAKMDAESESDQDCINRQAKANEAKDAKIKELLAECDAHTAKELGYERRIKSLKKELERTRKYYNDVIDNMVKQEKEAK